MRAPPEPRPQQRVKAGDGSDISRTKLSVIEREDNFNVQLAEWGIVTCVHCRVKYHASARHHLCSTRRTTKNQVHMQLHLYARDDSRTLLQTDIWHERVEAETSHNSLFQSFTVQSTPAGHAIRIDVASTPFGAPGFARIQRGQDPELSTAFLAALRNQPERRRAAPARRDLRATGLFCRELPFVLDRVVEQTLSYIGKREASRKAGGVDKASSLVRAGKVDEARTFMKTWYLDDLKAEAEILQMPVPPSLKQLKITWVNAIIERLQTAGDGGEYVLDAAAAAAVAAAPAAASDFGGEMGQSPLTSSSPPLVCAPVHGALPALLSLCPAAGAPPGLGEGAGAGAPDVAMAPAAAGARAAPPASARGRRRAREAPAAAGNGGDGEAPGDAKHPRLS